MSDKLFPFFQSEVNGFADFHLYVCAAFLKRFSLDVMKEEDFQVSTRTGRKDHNKSLYERVDGKTRLTGSF